MRGLASGVRPPTSPSERLRTGFPFEAVGSRTIPNDSCSSGVAGAERRRNARTTARRGAPTARMVPWIPAEEVAIER